VNVSESEVAVSDIITSLSGATLRVHRHRNRHGCLINAAFAAVAPEERRHTGVRVLLGPGSSPAGPANSDNRVGRFGISAGAASVSSFLQWQGQLQIVKTGLRIILRQRPIRLSNALVQFRQTETCSANRPTDDLFRESFKVIRHSCRSDNLCF